ncbi:MAG: DUF1838 domain-containing protein [Sphingomonadaceae bacterium]|uniref:DUF1838 family protein n=1 Tax=Thermaurantiacus sp. TaxID=2820283 RepID=UPI00298EF848|nr:DUF1838 family protein [Thermaurantiacus sp.]MCS6986016.1 DUF1838 domain-containing protein [Sphingomonadaceae bacterium]MDW8414768.1 DUF1838 family protein [Thermaurantiacus sp.]
MDDARWAAMDRRTTLGLAGVAWAGAAASARGAALPLEDPQFHLLTLGRLQGDLSGRPIYGYSRGRVFGVLPGAGLPLAESGWRLYDFEGGSITRSRRLPNGDIQSVSRTFLFYTDPETGAYLEEFRNPLTGRMVKVPPFRGGISASVQTLAGPKVTANFPMESTVFGRPPRLEFVGLGEHVVVTRHAFTRWTPRGAARARTEFTQDDWVVRRADLADPRLTWLPAHHHWTSQTEWQAWLEMPEGQPGAQLWRSSGIRFHRLADLPDRFRAEADCRHPGILTDPLPFPD